MFPFPWFEFACVWFKGNIWFVFHFMFTFVFLKFPFVFLIWFFLYFCFTYPLLKVLLLLFSQVEGNLYFIYIWLTFTPRLAKNVNITHTGHPFYFDHFTSSLLISHLPFHLHILLILCRGRKEFHNTSENLVWLSQIYGDGAKRHLEFLLWKCEDLKPSWIAFSYIDEKNIYIFFSPFQTRWRNRILQEYVGDICGDLG